jgi:FtsH-binding integral membrane protein
MGCVYLWMTGGLLSTTVVAMVAASNAEIQQTLFSSNLTFFWLIGAQFGLVLLISCAINKLVPPRALGICLLYSGLTGLTVSTIFLVYYLGSIGLAFGATASLLAGLSIVGLPTKKGLTLLGPILFTVATRTDCPFSGQLVPAEHSTGMGHVLRRSLNIRGPHGL